MWTSSGAMRWIALTFMRMPKLNFLNFGGRQRQSDGLVRKVFRIVRYYARLIPIHDSHQGKSSFTSYGTIKFEYFDRTLLMLYFKLLGKKIVFTAHNVNAGKRDANDSLLNRLTLRIQYRLADHIFVHTDANEGANCSKTLRFESAPSLSFRTELTTPCHVRN